jgi:hemoglobin/transferrin/lactoferrin receptor protein
MGTLPGQASIGAIEQERVMGLVGRNAAVLLGSAAIGVLVGVSGVKAQQAAPTQTTNDAEKQGRVTLLQRLILGAGVAKVAIDTPQAVTVLNQEDIDREQPETIGELFDSIPGVTAIGSDRVLGESFNIRGVGTAETSGDESKIIINVDGVKKFYEQYRLGSFFSDTELYKRVEVLRGPASSTLYGTGALGGVINFTTKDAADFIKDGMTGAARLKTAYYSNGDGTLVSPLLAHRFSENFEVLATGNWRRSDNFELADGRTLPGSEFTAWSGLLKGTAHFGDNNEQVLRASYQHWSSDADDQEYNQTGSASGFGLVDRSVVDKTAVLSYENPASDNPWLDLKASLSYSDTTVDQEGSPLGGFANGNYGYGTVQGNVQNTSEFSGEAWENFLTYGLQASSQDRTAEVNGTGAPITTHPEGTDNRLGLFVQDEFIWNEKLTIIPGIRGEFISQSPEIVAAGARDISDFAFSPKLASLYNFNDTFGVFGSVAHTERFPTLDELYQYSAPTSTTSGRTASVDLEKEESNNYEVGFTLSGNDLLQDGDSAALKTTAFYNKIKNLIVVNSNRPAGAPPPTYFSNVDNATIYGVEIEGSYDADMWFGRVAYTALEGENDDTGVALNSIPAHRVSLTLGGRALDYNLEFGAKVNLVASIDSGVVSADLTNATLRPPFPTTEGSDSYETVDLFASWKPQDGAMAGIEATFGVDNLFNEDFRDNQSNDRSKGRTFKISLAKQFDY